MRINSKNMFKSIVTTEKRLNAIEKRIFFKEQRLLQSQQNSINFMKFFDAGYQKGIDEGEKKGLKDGQTKGYQLGYEKIYNTANPFDFMEMISMQGKTNFFERNVSEYALATKMSDNNDAFEFSEEF